MGDRQLSGDRRGRGLAQEFAADRHANYAADLERHKARPPDRAAQFPYRNALHDQAECDDQRRGLRWRKEMQPHRGSDDAEGETCKTGDKGRGKRPEGEQSEINCVKAVHGIPHTDRARTAEMGQRLADRSG